MPRIGTRPPQLLTTRPHLAPPTLAQMPISPMSLYQVVGRKAPTEAEPMPPAYRMKLFAPNAVIAKVGLLSAPQITAITMAHSAAAPPPPLRNTHPHAPAPTATAAAAAVALLVLHAPVP